ncbi:hypothetical protein PT520_09420 [Aliarcobacter butzleri]|uniref:Uncharacterized protein n=1 Tax=Aliarcobacter butzleri TaxID=28197 RepID=A0AAW6VR48_9BACT|nr:hypothetical protein [Aliarcobacter butzleri]MDK2062734.1 hypothetical protein [Aliarcobacter butzleri]
MKYCNKYKKTHHYIPIYGVNINIVFNQDDFKYLCETYQDYKVDRELSKNGETLMNLENNEVTIGIFNNDLSTIVHESTHASLFILDTHFMNPSDSNGEAMAYLQSYLFDLIRKKMKKYIAKVKHKKVKSFEQS